MNKNNNILVYLVAAVMVICLITSNASITSFASTTNGSEGDGGGDSEGGDATEEAPPEEDKAPPVEEQEAPLPPVEDPIEPEPLPELLLCEDGVTEVQDLADCPTIPIPPDQSAAITTEPSAVVPPSTNQLPFPETETEAETEAEAEEEEEEPIDPCLLDPSDPSCPKPDPTTGECPPGWNQNEDGNCFPEHDRCPKGYHSHEDDETGRCIPDSTPCEPGYITDPDFPTCSKKVDVCKKHPELEACNGKDDTDDDDTDVDVDIIIKNINKHETITKTVKHDRSTFPNIDIIGLSIKDNGDSMICLINIDKEHVQCQEFNVPNSRADTDISRIIEVDSGKEYDNGNTGSSEIDAVIKDINDQDFNALEDADNHNFKVDLAALGMNDNGDGMVCIIDDDKSDKGKALCEPFKVADAAVSGQITEIVEFD